MKETLEHAQANAPLHSILVVDDEDIVLVALRETFQHEGYNVVTCSSAVEALKLLREESFSVILSDQQMPLITGLELLAQVKQIQPDATRILITAVLNLSTVIDAINKGEIYRFIVKPWLREELLATVRNAVQRYELICQNLVLQATTRSMNEKLTRLNQTLQEQVDRFTQENRKLAQSVETSDRNIREFANICGRIMEVSHPELARRTRSAVALCQAVGAALELSQADRHVLEVSAGLHAIGLLRLPSELVERWRLAPDKLSAEERAQIEQHPVRGQELVRLEGSLESVGAIIRAQNERFDGTGFPDGLRAEAIPWLARLLAAVITFAETSPNDSDTEVQRIKRESGAAFDPKAVRAVLRAASNA